MYRLVILVSTQRKAACLSLSLSLSPPLRHVSNSNLQPEHE